MAPKPSAEDLACFLAHSPAAHAHKVTAPLCFLVGAKDRRVVSTDARLFVAGLRGQKQPPTTRMVVFPEDTHALDRPQAEYEGFLTHAWWFKQHMS